MRVLAGDIGGTKTAVAMVEIGARTLTIARFHKYPSGDFGSLEEILEDFLARERGRPAVAAFGVAGPVRNGRAKVTKLPWTIDERSVGRAAGIRKVRVLNDFIAAALGISYLTARQVSTLAAGDPEPDGPIGVIGAGTGLGQAALIKIGGRYEPVPSEGGHADFGPRDPTEDRLVSFVRKRFGRVSRDRLLSGEGLTLLYDFFKEEGLAPESAAVARAFEKEDRAAVISRFALAGGDRLCHDSLRLFVSLYGSEAGNLALQYRATGGLYIGGGIAPRILGAFRWRGFLDSLRRKPPMEDLLSRIPVRLVREPRLGLFGAAAAAYRTVMETTRLSRSTSTRPRRR
jgi:glucokinase